MMCEGPRPCHCATQCRFFRLDNVFHVDCRPHFSKREKFCHFFNVRSLFSPPSKTSNFTARCFGIVASHKRNDFRSHLFISPITAMKHRSLSILINYLACHGRTSIFIRSLLRSSCPTFFSVQLKINPTTPPKLTYPEISSPRVDCLFFDV